MRKQLMGLAASVALALAGLSTTAAALTVGEAPPDTLGRDYAGHLHEVKQYQGKVLVVTFWASWCAPCRSEMQRLEYLQRAGDGRLEVVAINIESPERFQTVARVLRQGKVTVTLTNDAKGRIKPSWGVDGIPHMFIIDRDGRLAYEHSGYGDDMIPALVDEVNQLLKAPAGAAAGTAPAPTRTLGT